MRFTTTALGCRFIANNPRFTLYGLLYELNFARSVKTAVSNKSCCFYPQPTYMYAYYYNTAYIHYFIETYRGLENLHTNYITISCNSVE